MSETSCGYESQKEAVDTNLELIDDPEIRVHSQSAYILIYRRIGCGRECQKLAVDTNLRKKLWIRILN